MVTSALILNWQELNVSRDSVRRMLKEPEIDQVVLVDNGSTDGSKQYYKDLKHDKFVFVDLPKNMGPSVGRNKGIKLCEGDYIFLCDGDILYVPDTVREYSKILNYYKDAFCVGQNSYQYETMVDVNRHANGIGNPIEADIRMSDDYIISDWFPMSWTQYGLFRANLLHEYPFIEEGAFGEAGYGLEDDDFYHEMKKRGYVSLAVNKPIYYHEAHTGIKELIKSNINIKTKLKQRTKIFEKKWGKRSQWSEYLADNKPDITTRPSPS